MNSGQFQFSFQEKPFTTITVTVIAVSSVSHAANGPEMELWFTQRAQEL